MSGIVDRDSTMTQHLEIECKFDVEESTLPPSFSGIRGSLG